MTSFMLLWLCINIISYQAFAEFEINEDITITQISRSPTKQRTHLSIKILTAIQNDFYKLSNPQIVSVPHYNPNSLAFAVESDDNTENECIHNDQTHLTQLTRSQCCYQSFTISCTDDAAQCPLYLKGSFGIKFDIECNDESIVLVNKCTDYKALNSDETTLQVSITYEDSICNAQVFNVAKQSTHRMRFFTNAEYSEERSESELYSPDDTCYAQIEIQHPSSYDVLRMHLENVWLCSAPPTEDIFSGDGCFDDDIDVDDNNGPFWIIRNHETGPSKLDAHIISESSDDVSATTIIRYAFKIPEMRRDALYIHNQISVNIGAENERSAMIIWTVIARLNIRHVFMPYDELYRNVKLIDGGKRWMLLLGIVLVCMMAVMLSMKVFRIYASVEYETDVIEAYAYSDEDDSIRKPMVIRRRDVDINNYNAQEDEDEYIDFEYDNDPLDQSY